MHASSHRTSQVGHEIRHSDGEPPMTNLLSLRSPSLESLDREEASQRAQVPHSALSPPCGSRNLPPKFTCSREMRRGPSRMRVEKPYSASKRSRLQHEFSRLQSGAIRSQASTTSPHRFQPAERSPPSSKRVATRELLRRDVLMSRYSARLASENEALEQRIAAMERKHVHLMRQAQCDDCFGTASESPSYAGQQSGFFLQLRIVSGLDRLWSSIVDRFHQDAPAPPMQSDVTPRPLRLGRYQAVCLRSLSTTSPLTG